MFDHSIDLLRAHSVYEVATMLSDFLGVEKDWICTAEFLSLCAGRMAMPINLDIASDQCSMDLVLADRITSIVPGKCIPIDTHRSYLSAERNGFEDKYVLHCRRHYPRLHHDIVNFMSKAPETSSGAPSVWRFHDGFGNSGSQAPTLRLIGIYADRDFDSVARSIASMPGNLAYRKQLSDVIETLCPRTNFQCRFRNEFHGAVAPANMLIVERLLQVFVNIRRFLTDYRSASEILPSDYEALRALLVNLPLVPIDRVLSSVSIETATGCDPLIAHGKQGNHRGC